MYAYEKQKLFCSLIMEDPVAGRTMSDIKSSAIKDKGPTDKYVRAHEEGA